MTNYGIISGVDLLDWALDQGIGGTFLTDLTVTGLPVQGYFNGLLTVAGQDRGLRIWNQHGNCYSRNTVSGGWSGSKWIIYATATSPQEFDIPLAEGLSAINPCTYRKNQFGEVSFGGAASGTIEVGTAIATLPSGFRPQKTVERPAVYASANGAWTGGTLAITTDGIVRAYGQISATSVAFAVDFVAADY